MTRSPICMCHIVTVQAARDLYQTSVEWMNTWPHSMTYHWSFEHVSVFVEEGLSESTTSLWDRREPAKTHKNTSHDSDRENLIHSKMFTSWDKRRKIIIGESVSIVVPLTWRLCQLLFTQNVVEINDCDLFPWHRVACWNFSELYIYRNHCNHVKTCWVSREGALSSSQQHYSCFRNVALNGNRSTPFFIFFKNFPYLIFKQP